MNDLESQILPKLNPLLKIYPDKHAKDGSPQWVLHLPVSNAHYRIGWSEFECISRMHQCNTIDDLILKVNEQTTLEIDEQDVQIVLNFLNQKGLLLDAKAIAKKEMGTGQAILKNYLFFSIPIVKPEKLFDSIYPFVKPFFSKVFLICMTLVCLLSLFMTLQDSALFFKTFTGMFSMEGIILTAIAFMFAKILHELGHALTAKHFGVDVPHMGVAFMVFYPVLYTELSGLWRVSSQKQRIYIGLSGVITEIFVAAIALIAWQFLSPGIGQSIAFSLAVVSLLGSLLINLNPFMRFDGYYVLSDILAIDNLHSKAIGFAKNWIRSTFFGLKEPVIDATLLSHRSFLIWFGLGVIVYRFFLFLGIAVLVYVMTFKPLGLILMILELAVFIGMPVLKEIQYLWSKKVKIMQTVKGRAVLILCAVLIVWLFLPMQSNIRLNAIVHPKQYQDIKIFNPGLIEKIYVTNGQKVDAGDVLIEMDSNSLTQEIRKARQNLDNLEQLKKRQLTKPDVYLKQEASIDDQIDIARVRLEELQKSSVKMRVRAPFAGVVHDVPIDIHPNRYVGAGTILMRVINPNEMIIVAYIKEKDLDRIQIGDKTKFTPSYSLTASSNMRIDYIEQVSVKDLKWAQLSALYGGNIVTGVQGQTLEPVESLYRVFLRPEQPLSYNQVYKGIVDVNAKPSSFANNLYQYLSKLWIKESGL